MKKSYSLLFSILIIIFIGIFIYSYFFKEIIEGTERALEGFSMDTSAVSSATSSVSSAASSASSSAGYYDNLTRLSPDNVWSSSTKKALLDYMNSTLLSKEPNATPLKDDSAEFQTFLKQYQPYATDSEVTSYIKNGEWPWDGYITDTLNNVYKPMIKRFNKPTPTDDDIDKMMKDAKKMTPNRLIYMWIMRFTVPQLSIIQKLNFGGYEPTFGTNMQCVFLREGEQTQPDGTTKINIEKEGKYLQLNNVYTLDNNAYISIPGFVFQSQPCNVCDITDYTDPKNTCLFTIKTPEAFDKYMGENSLTSSTSSITSGTSNVSSAFGSTTTDDKKDSKDTSSSSSSSWF
jgi:hypothetical protein